MAPLCDSTAQSMAVQSITQAGPWVLGWLPGKASCVPPKRTPKARNENCVLSTPLACVSALPVPVNSKAYASPNRGSRLGMWATKWPEDSPKPSPSQSLNRAKRRNGDRHRTARRARKRLLTRPQHCYALLTDLGQAPVPRSCRGTIMSMSPVDAPHSRAPETRSTFLFIGPGYTAKGVLRLGTREEPVGRGRLQHHIFRSILASIDAVHL